ncbi:hypothetical protein CDAR_461821 [Caerostris darwini]|uniref:Capsid protein n=1 Tax=Caerostris darwini TaxID=1538125 RepID=A0AAV4TBY7_9ARAC|nr:hypothetical protein CDAR_461821 [Caerostris darwini]
MARTGRKKRYRWEAPVKINLYPRPTTSNPVFKKGGVLSGDLDMRVVHQQGYFFYYYYFSSSAFCMVPIYLNSSIDYYNPGSCLHMTFTYDRAHEKHIFTDRDRPW